jgi:hypothetical protein
MEKYKIVGRISILTNRGIARQNSQFNKDAVDSPEALDRYLKSGKIVKIVESKNTEKQVVKETLKTEKQVIKENLKEDKVETPKLEPRSQLGLQKQDNK